ncbi:MAG: hypothetical protein B7Y25_03090 [Alphaproteobacteria bacterium 16-39-46]|nr:MAG: hypothetical protein B7Y25_03090 [Alphaproteobacteria bacterium 16-39-46]OZA43399.1 MAG: hypothetical protein B7X84_03290 [Alphaproteobacteria bacterium 17-39-52]HQS83888.1 NAD(P)H-dependent oxidoreductase [Alphaproteobacteria bacterium]HQS93723.1 NAD(P)H-dependent oxidoreductase [Alphaproteobacteria bacterium]
MKKHEKRKLYFSLKTMTIVLSIFTSERAISIGPEIELATIGAKTVMRTVKNLLVVNVSPNLNQSHSKALSMHFVERLQKRYPGQYSPCYKDLEKEPIPHLSSRNLEVIMHGTATTPEAKILKGLSDTLIGDMRRANAIVFSTPMHNFTVPASLKAYFDIVLRAGETFKYTSNGPEGMLADRPVILISTSGGCYAETEGDFLTPYIKYVLRFIGIRNVTSVIAEGLAIESKKNSSLTTAREVLERHLEPFHQSLTQDS